MHKLTKISLEKNASKHLLVTKIYKTTCQVYYISDSIKFWNLFERFSIIYFLYKHDVKVTFCFPHNSLKYWCQLFRRADRQRIRYCYAFRRKMFFCLLHGSSYDINTFPFIETPKNPRKIRKNSKNGSKVKR